MENQVNLERNKIFHLEDSVIMYGIYNSEMIEKLIKTIQKIHNETTGNENLLVGKLKYWYQWYLPEEGVVHYAINSPMHINTLRQKDIKMYEKFINQLKCLPM